MAYTKHTWKKGEPPKATLLNNIENEVEELGSVLEIASSGAETILKDPTGAFSLEVDSSGLFLNEGSLGSTIFLTGGSGNFSIIDGPSNGKRGILLAAHGTGGAKWALSFGTNNEVTLNGYATENLSLAGGVVSGGIHYNTTADASKTDNGVSASSYYTTSNIRDSSGRIMARLEGTAYTNGSIGSYWYVRNYDTSGTLVAQKGIQMTITKDGTLTYYVSDPAKFRAAIGATADSSAIGTVGGSSRPIWFNNGVATQVATPLSGNWYTGVPFITSAGVMEVGKYIDFHDTNNATTDYDVRLYTSGTDLITTGGFYISSGHFQVPNGSVYIGQTSSTTERKVHVMSSAGDIYMLSQGSSTGNRGIYILAHGTGAAKFALQIDANNNVTLNGNATTATALTSNAGDANTPVYFSGGKPVATSKKLGAENANGYWGMKTAENDNGWIRTTTQGIIPYQSGGAGSGHSSLGTSTWYFANAYIDNIYGTLNGHADNATYLRPRGNASNFSTDFNDIFAPGLYSVTGTTMTNAPAIYKWSFLEVFGAGSGMTVQTIYGGTYTFSRKYAGNPEAWGAWTRLDTTYSAGTGISLSGTTFSLAAWTTLTDGNAITMASGFTNVASTIRHNGRMGAYVCHFKTTNALTAGTTYTVATFKKPWPAIWLTVPECFLNVNADFTLRSTDGVLRLKPRANIAAGTELAASFCLAPIAT